MYTGSVGSGKSYHATELGLQWIKRGKHVVANFPIKKKKRRTKFMQHIEDKMFARWIYMPEITVPKLIALSIEKGWLGKESQCLLLIDEAGVYFNSRDWQIAGQARMRWIKFGSQSRKMGYDIIFVCQFDRMIDRQIRSLAEYEVKHLKANNSFMFRFLSIFRITLFLYVYRWYQTKLKANLRFGIYKPWIANRYDTMRTFNLDELIDEIRKMYDGTIVPAPVMAQIGVWEEEIKQRLEEKAEGETAASGEEPPEGDPDAPADPSASVGGLGDDSPSKTMPELARCQDGITRGDDCTIDHGGGGSDGTSV